MQVSSKKGLADAKDVRDAANADACRTHEKRAIE
jgi:hypothetical protein